MQKLNSQKILLYCAFFLSGLSALVYEVVWMRMLTVTFGSTVFSATTVISAFMGGLALGAYVAGKFVDSIKSDESALKIYGALELFVGVYCIFTPLIFFFCDILYGFAYSIVGGNFYALSIFKFLLSAVVMLLPTFLM